MDAKQTGLLIDLHARLVAGNFGETDVQSLISLLREESPKRGPIRELGDFAAHRLRDYGPVHSYLKNVKTILDRLGTQKDLLNIKVVFTESEIANAFDLAFADHGISPLSTQRHRQLQLALVSMLQGIRFADKTGRGFGTLNVAVTRDLVQLRGVVTMKKSGARAAFPVLTVTNDCYPMLSPNGQVTPKSMLRVVIRQGVTVLEGLKPYEIHIGRKKEKGGTEPPPIEWLEVEAALKNSPVHSVRSENAEFDILGIDGLPVVFKLRNGQISFAGRPEYFVPASPIWQGAASFKNLLRARVYDDLGGYLFETVDTLKQIEPA